MRDEKDRNEDKKQDDPYRAVVTLLSARDAKVIRLRYNADPHYACNSKKNGEVFDITKAIAAKSLRKRQRYKNHRADKDGPDKP